MHNWICAIAAACAVLPAWTADATEFRRPFDAAIGLGYGYDHDGGGSGCTAYDCGGRCYDGHRGNDYPLPLGTVVRAAAAGNVTYVSQGCPNVGYYCSQCGGGFGNYVKVRHADGRDTYYGHMKNGSVVVSNGQQVSCGQKLGESASSGCSTGYHLHFDLRVGSSRIDPYAGGCAPGSSDWVNQGSGMPSTQCQVTCQCTPGETRTGDCGNCGRRTRTCQANCQWGSWGACTGEGECSAGASQTRDCGDCGSQSRRCSSNCSWGAFDACEGPDPDGGNRSCDAGGYGPCADGRVRCREGNHACEALYTPTDERCDAIDNDCNGDVDDGEPQELGDPRPPWAAQVVDASWPRTLTRGEVGAVWADFRNSGSEPWVGGRVWLQAAMSGPSEVSPLYHKESWQAWDVPAVVWDDVSPGEIARVEFSILASEAEPQIEAFRLRTPEGEPMLCPRPRFEIEVTTEEALNAVPQEADPGDPSPARAPDRLDATGAVGCACSTTAGRERAPWLFAMLLLGLVRRRS